MFKARDSVKDAPARGSVLICGARRSRRFNVALQINVEAG
jgi:hypothetical protein